MRTTFMRATDSLSLILLAAFVSVLATAAIAGAEDRPYFVAYDHRLEEPGNLQVDFYSTLGFSKESGRFGDASLEFEYGITNWWTTELYLSGQSTWGKNAVFSGYQWDNRFRPLRGDHRINPLLFIEFESAKGVERTPREVVGSRRIGLGDDDDAEEEREREIEMKFILSSVVHKWDICENFTAVKELGREPWEFGYSVGASRSLAVTTSGKSRIPLINNLRAGIEVYGGLGDWNSLSLSGTSHYIAPVLAWELPHGMNLRISPSFGLTRNSYPFLLGFGLSYDIAGVGARIRSLFR